MRGVILVLINMFLSILLSNFISLQCRKKGNDFSFKEYMNNFKAPSKKRTRLYLGLIFGLSLFPFLINNYNYLYIILVSCLLLAFISDVKFKIIPHTADIGIILCAIINIILNFSVKVILSSILGAVTGAGIFYIIDKLCVLFTKKNGFGMGDIKLFFSLGLFFGLEGILVIEVISIILSAIYSIFFLLYNKIKNIKEEYIAFGPFIVISSLILMIIPPNVIIDVTFNAMDKIINKILWCKFNKR